MFSYFKQNERDREFYQYVKELCAFEKVLMCDPLSDDKCYASDCVYKTSLEYFGRNDYENRHRTRFKFLIKNPDIDKN